VRPSQPIFLSGCIAAISVVFSASSANATVVDFNGIPEGTPVSVGNPYAGVLNIDAKVQWTTIDGTFSAEGIIGTHAPFYPSGDGVVQALPPLIPDTFEFSSEVTASFLQPVIDGTMDVFVFRNAGYSYTGADDVGDIFNGGGVITGNIESGGLLTWQQIGLSLPLGYHLTGFTIDNHDPANSDAAVWVDNVAFTVVPEPSTAALLDLGLGLLSVLFRLSRTSSGKSIALCRLND